MPGSDTPTKPLLEDIYRQIVETTQEGIWQIDAEANTSFVNQALADMFGYTVQEMMGRKLLEFMDDESAKSATKYIERRREGIREHHDFVFLKKDGTKLWTTLAANPRFDERGTYYGSLAIVNDVTAERRNSVVLTAQKSIFERLLRGGPNSLTEALELLVRAFEGIIDGVRGSVLLTDPDAKRLMFGAGKSIPESFHKAIEGRPVGIAEGSCGSAVALKQIVITPDIFTDNRWKQYWPLAREHHLRSCWSSPIFDRKQNVLGTFALYFSEVRSPTESELQLIQDATAVAAVAIEHVRINESLVDSERRFRALSEATSEGIIIHEGGTIQVANEGVERLYGYTREELIGKNLLDLCPPEFHAEVIDSIRNHRNKFYDTEGLRKDGSRVWIEVRAREALIEGRQVRVVSARDISDRRNLEIERERNLERERQARIDAERSVKLHDDFLAIASHELKTPLTPLKMYLQLLKHALRDIKLPPTRQAELLVDALENTDREYSRLLNLIDDLLDVSRITVGRLLLNRERCDLAKITRDTLKRFQPEIEKSKCTITLTGPDSVPGNWDPARIEQIVTNLLTNALKYGAGLPIDISMSMNSTGTLAQLVVKDQGIGIASEDQEKIFDRFVRVAPIQHYGGLGLGLYIVKQIVSAHQGQISVKSGPGPGACFQVDLPIS